MKWVYKFSWVDAKGAVQEKYIYQNTQDGADQEFEDLMGFSPDLKILKMVRSRRRA